MTPDYNEIIGSKAFFLK